MADYLRGRTRGDALFVALTGVFHSSAVPYERHQQWVEWLMDNKSLALELGHRSVDEIEEFFQSGPANLPGLVNRRSRANMYPGAIQCYEDVCGADGKGCATYSGGDALVRCMVEHARGPRDEGSKAGGIGPKTRNLLYEYIGDPTAVAVDRHVFRFLCNNGIYVPKDEKGRPLADCCDSFLKDPAHPQAGYNLGEPWYSRAKDAFLEYAADCGANPVDLQVGAWFKGVCGSEPGRARAVYLGKNGYFPCVKVVPLEHFAEMDDVMGWTGPDGDVVAQIDGGEPSDSQPTVVGTDIFEPVGSQDEYENYI